MECKQINLPVLHVNCILVLEVVGKEKVDLHNLGKECMAEDPKNCA